MIQMSDVNFSYDSRPFIDALSFELMPGWTSIVGPNGAGKSTLIQLMNGTLKPTSGEVLMKGKDIGSYDSKERARHITTIVQQPQIRFPITCFEMVSYGRYPWRQSMNGLTEDDYRMIHQSMEDTGTLCFRDKKVTELSGGERQRVILAAALSQAPKVLFVDEGFSALDIKHKREMIRCLKQRIEQEGLTVIAIIHDLNVAYQISDHVVMLKDGDIVECGSKERVMTRDTIERVYETEVRYDSEFGFGMKI